MLRTEFQGVDGFWRDVGGVGLPCEFRSEGHCDGFCDGKESKSVGLRCCGE